MLLPDRIQIRGSHDPFLELQMPVTSPSCSLYFWGSVYKSEAPTTCSLGSVNLLEGLTECREVYYLLDHQIFIKRHYNSGAARWKRCTGQPVGEVQSSASALLSQYLCVLANPACAPNPVLWGFYGGFIT